MSEASEHGDRVSVGPRVRVSSVDGTPRRHRPEAVRRPVEVDAAELLFARGLRRSQLRLALACLASCLVLVAALAVTAALPGLDRFVIAGVPVPWLVQAVGFYPVVIGHAVVFGLAAARNERRYRRLVGAE